LDSKKRKNTWWLLGVIPIENKKKNYIMATKPFILEEKRKIDLCRQGPF
jgi:hypothetical protein